MWGVNRDGGVEGLLQVGLLNLDHDVPAGGLAVDKRFLAT